MQKLKVSEKKIFMAIYSLVQQKIIVPGSILTREQILKNPTRSLIYETIKTQPGIHIRYLCSVLNKSSGVVRAHLKVLENFNYIRRKTYKTPKYTLIFQKDFPETYDDFFVVWKNENDKRIIQLLLNQQLTISKLSSQLNLHHSTIQYHLEKLDNLKLIIEVQLNQTIKYTFNQKRREAFDKFHEKY